MLGLYVDGYCVAVACGCMYQPLIQPLFAHELLTFYAVLLWVQLKVEVMQQTDNAPEIGLVAVAELVCEVFHNAGHDKPVLNMEWVGVVLFQKLKSLLFVRDHRKSLL